MKFNLEQVGQMMEWWQRQLGLQHWRIDIGLVRGYELEDRYGECHWTLTKNRATIRIIDPGDVPNHVDAMDIEEVVVHELLHIVFAAWDDLTRTADKPLPPVIEAVCIEQPIDKLALLLIQLRKASSTPFDWELL